MGSIKFNTNRTKVELTGITETESSTLSGKGKQTSVLPTYKPNFKDVNLTTIQAQARTPVFKSVTTPRKYTTPTKKPKIELPKYTPFTQEEVGLLQHQTRLPMALPKSNLTSKAATNTEYALKSNPTAYGFMEGFSPLATKKQLSKQLGQEIDTTGAEDTLGYKVGYGAGLMGQYAITGGIAHAGVRQGLTRAIPSLAKSVGKTKAKNVLGVMGSSALADLLTGVPINTVQAIKESTVGEDVNWNQFAKSFAVNTAIDVVFGGLIEGVLVLKSGKKIKTVGDLKTVTPDESKEITEQLMLNSPKYKENLMLNAPTNKLLNIPQKQLTQPVNYVDELGNISNEPNFNAAKNVLQEEPYVKNKIKVTVKRPSGNYEKFDDDWDFGWDGNDINLINGWIEFSKSHGKTPTELLKSQLNKTQIEIDKAFDEAKDYFLNYQGKGVDLVEMVDLPGRKVRESLNDEWYRRWYEKNKKVPTKKDKLQIAEEEFMEDIRAASDGNRDGEFVSEELAKRYSLFNKLENMFNKLPDDTINVELRGEDDMSAFIGQETSIVKPDYTKKPFIERVETPKRVYAGELPQGSKLPENTLSKKIIEKKKAEPIILGGKVETPTNIKQPTIAKRTPLKQAETKLSAKKRTFYTGSPNANIESFKIGGDGSTKTSGDSFGKGIYLSDNKNVAKQYAQGNSGKVYEVSSNNKLLDLEAKADKSLVSSVSDLVNNSNKEYKNSLLRGLEKPEKRFLNVDEASKFFDEQEQVWKKSDGEYTANKPLAKKEGNEFIVKYTDFNSDISKLLETQTNRQIFRNIAAINSDTASEMIVKSGYDGIEFLDGGAFNGGIKGKTAVIYTNTDNLKISTSKAEAKLPTKVAKAEPKADTKIPTKFKSVEAELKSLTAEMKVTPPTETQIKRYKQLKAQVKPAKIPTREPVSTVEPVKSTKPTLTPKTEKVASNVTKTDNIYFDTISNATEKTKAEKRLSEPITFVDNKGNITKATRKEYIEDIAMIDGSQIKTTQKLRTNGGKTFEVNEYRAYKTPNSKEPIKISKYEKDYFDFAKKNQDNVVQSVTPYKKPIKKVDKSLPPKNTTNPIDLVMASSKKVQKGFKESVIDRGLEVKRKFVDSGDTVAIIGKITGDKGLYHSYNKARSSTRSAEHVLGEAQTNIIGDKVGESLKDIFKPIRKKGDGYYNDFQLYLLHKHNVDRMAHGKPVFGEDITADISIAEAKSLLKEYPEFEELAQKIYKFNKNNMQYRVDADLITAEQAKMFEEMYPHYVPTIRAKKSVPQPPKNSKTDVTGKIAQTIKEATGDSSPILPLHESMARQTMQIVTASEKNIFANRLIKNVTPETSRYVQDINVIAKDFNPDDELINAMKGKKESEELKNYFTLFRNGEAYQVKVDEGLFEGLEALTSSNRSTDAIIEAVTAGNTMFKQLITGYSPTFLVRNGARDLQDVGIYSKNLREFAIQYPKAIKEMTSNGELWQRYKALGGTGSSFFDYAKGFKKDPTFIRKNTLNKIENLNMAVEQLPRFTEFMATLSKGDGSYDNLLEALYNSADITVNFGRTGTWGKTLNQTFVPFFNPAMQGFDKLARTLKYTKGWKDWTKLTIKATALGITPALINEIVYSDDPDYANLYSRDKDINYLFKLDNNVWIRIPKGRVLSLIGGAAQRTVRLASGDKDAYAGFLKVAKEQVAPISPFESNIVSPILAVQNNKAWHGGTIEPQRLTGSAGLRYDESTTIPAKWLGAKLNYSPKKIDYLVDAYTGIIGDLAIPLTTPKAEVHPFAKAFTIDGATTNRISQDFYDKKTEISESYSDNKDNTSYIQNRYLNKQSDMASELFEEIRTVQNSKLTDVQKRTKVREIRALINVIEKNALDSLPEVEKTTKKLVNKYPDTDDLYREVNREVFGSEYALKLYNKTVYEKAQTYVTEKAAPSFNKNVATIPQKNGITWDNYYDGYFAQKDETSDISKAVALQGKNITTLYDAFGISDKNANIAAALSKNDLGKAYNTTYQKISNSEATKSAEKIAIIKQNNPTLSTSELRILYEAFNVAESIGGYTRKYS